MGRPLVSVIITTKNEQQHIGNCLNALLKQNYQPIEVIVVDNHSTDRTQIIARDAGAQVYAFGPERSAQRNIGMREKANGEYVMYLDADMTVSAKVIGACVERMETHRDVGALYVSEIVTGKNFWSRVRAFERSFYDATVIDCVRFIRREIFHQVGGFDEAMTGPEDWDFDKKIRQTTKVGLIREPIYHNEAAFNLTRYLKKKNYYAKSFDTYIAKWGKNDPDIKRQFGLWYRYVGVFTEDGKWATLLKHPLLTTGMLVLRGLVGVVFLTRRNGAHTRS